MKNKKTNITKKLGKKIKRLGWNYITKSSSTIVTYEKSGCVTGPITGVMTFRGHASAKHKNPMESTQTNKKVDFVLSCFHQK